MSEIAEVFNAIKKERKFKRRNNLKLNQPDSSWTKHTEYHYSKTILYPQTNERVLVNYWPSSNKWQVGKKMYRGGLPKILLEALKETKDV